MALIALFAALLACTAVHVAGQPGFLSIDCGREANYSGYKSSYTGIEYISDGPYVDGGENHMVAVEYESDTIDQYRTLSSFPSGVRNCYTLPTESGPKYLVRMEFYHGHYDGKKSSSLHFDLHLGTNYWDRYDSYGWYWSEAVFVAWASWAPVCLIQYRKNGVAETLNWETRVRIVLKAAEGLDYLHKGCILPIIHRDVKTSNILLGQNLQAKIADFGLCKTYLSDTQTHISTNAAGSAGYFDAEYYHTSRLTESTDVYSFGVVLLEIVTGEPPILPRHGHIVQRVKQKIATTGDISSVADARLSGAYEVSSVWKVLDTAMACTADDAVRRPRMAAMVVQLKESLALEDAREDSVIRISPKGGSVGLMSTVGPSARHYYKNDLYKRLLFRL